MSHMSAAVHSVCAALDKCFVAYGDHRLASTEVRHPMDGVAIVDFSIVARDIEAYGSLAIVVDIESWDGVVFVSDFSTRSRRWLEHGLLPISAPEFAREFAAACADGGDFDLILPTASSIRAGFRFDLPEVC